MDKAKEAKKKERLSVDDLENVSGGYIYLNDEGAYEVIDWNGNVAGTFTGADAIDKCVKMCKERGFSDRVIYWEDVEDMRSNRE